MSMVGRVKQRAKRGLTTEPTLPRLSPVKRAVSSAVERLAYTAYLVILSDAILSYQILSEVDSIRL
jgi:hypothetical protein